MKESTTRDIAERLLDKATWQEAYLSCVDYYDLNQVVFECEDREISFEEYESVSNHLAQVLIENGLTCGKTIALKMSKSEKLFIALFAVIKTGAALLPIPDEAPKKRVQDIFEQVSVDFTLTDKEYEVLVCQSVSNEDKVALAKPDDIALILFTSGSTGKPKGVRYTQAGALQFLYQYPHEVQKTGTMRDDFDCVITKSNIDTLSIFLFEAPMALIYKKRSVILTKDEQNSPACIGKAIEKQTSASLFLTPSQIDSYLNSEDFSHQFKALKLLVLIGEPISGEVISKIIDAADSTTNILLLYGCTETALISAQDARCDEPNNMQVISDTNVLIVDKEGNSVEDGTFGEIAVSSKHQLKDYANVEVKQITSNGVSYYCTGDMGVINADGTLCIKGRKDRMVNYHGIRLELGGVEKNISRFPDILECAVVVNKTEAGSKLLSAFYVAKDGAVIHKNKLREFLKDYYPPNLIPVGMTQLDAIPINKNGKRNYPELENMPVVLETTVNAQNEPVNIENEEKLCRIISKLTKADVTPVENLFSLGMDSLMAFRIISELKEEGLELTIEDLFSEPIIRNLAGRVKEAQVKDLLHDSSGVDGANNASVDNNGAANEGCGKYVATGTQAYWGLNIDAFKKMHGLYVSDGFISSKIYTKEEFYCRIKTMLKKHPAMRSHFSMSTTLPAQQEPAAKGSTVDSTAIKNAAMTGSGAAAKSNMASDSASAAAAAAVPVQTISNMEHVGICSFKDVAKSEIFKDVKKDTYCLVDFKDITGLGDEATCEHELSKAQRDYIENFKMQVMGFLEKSDNVFAFQAAYFQVNETLSVIVFTGNHASVDGTSMNILIEEFLAPTLDDTQDCYTDFLSYIGKKESIEKSVNFYVDYLKGAEISALPEANIAQEGKTCMPEFKGETIALGKSGTKLLYEKSFEEKVTPIGYVMFAYAHALRSILKKDALVMQILTFGRGVPVSGMERAVGCFIEYIPVVIRKSDTAISFQNANLAAEQNSFVPLSLVWKQAFGLKQPPKLPPFLISEVFPDINYEGHFEKLTKLDFEKLLASSFIVKDNEEIKVIFHYDATKVDEQSFLNMIDKMRSFLHERGMVKP